MTASVRGNPVLAPALATAIEAAAAWLQANAPGAPLQADSRRVKPGDVFFAYATPAQFGSQPGTQLGLQAGAPAAVQQALAANLQPGLKPGSQPGPQPGARPALDGRAFIGDALARGAIAVVYDDRGFAWNPDWQAPHRAIADLQAVAGLLASRHYGHPDADMFSVAVTGTNGKTSCTQWLGDALSRQGLRTAVVGTFGVGVYQDGKAGDFDVTGYTTPDALQLQAALAKARADGVSALAIEASSIGLQQQRLLGLHVDVALLTNLTRDHLDYHGDMLAYEAAKTGLFDWPALQHAVLNLDDPMGLRLVERLGGAQARATRQARGAPTPRLVGYTLGPATPELLATLGADALCLSATEIRSSHLGTQFQLQVLSATATATATATESSTLPATMTVRTHLVGDFNVSNALGVLGVLLAKGICLQTAVAALEALCPVPGRMQQIGGPEQPLVVIDYAHTPDALQKALASLRQLAQERQGALWCVFGCGGDRDPGKRPQMGAIAQAADHVIVTSDNPRNETPAAIIADIVAGIDPARTAQVIEDRATAILWALRHAGKNDVILLAGKGHENTQEIRGRKLQFLDADHAALALGARATMKGPA